MSDNEKPQVEPEVVVVQESKDSSGLTKNEKIIAAFAYLIFFLPLLITPNSVFGKFHANQALLLLIFTLAVNIIAAIIPVFGYTVITPLGGIVEIVLIILGFIKAFEGKKERLPVIGQWDLIKS